MKITFLGTGTSQGVPVIACNCEVCNSLDYRDKRLRVSIHIEVENKEGEEKSFIIDTGADFRQQCLRERITKLDAVLYTHQHKDHTAGMDEVRSFNFVQQKDMPIYARQPVLEQLKREFAYIFAEYKYPGVPSVETHSIENETFEIEGVTITPIDVLHYKLPVFGFRIGDFTYITDVNFISDQELEKVKGTKILVLGALQKEQHISHFTLQEALDVIEKLQPQKAYLTHISHKMGLHKEVSEELPANVEIAYDGLQIKI
ncbi:MBL fold metallo-hydrolase [Bernardetia sp.]|uniref:MBL fold metallo-hydrolase n=1 Tax=Bernardetia sp. TaxID=1937974 RepID=UPI0025BE7225|nr:MBL fold metallo-hydrolase [Bernardetia sp.]